MQNLTNPKDFTGIRLYALRQAVGWHFLCEGVNN